MPDQGQNVSRARSFWWFQGGWNLSPCLSHLLVATCVLLPSAPSSNHSALCFHVTSTVETLPPSSDKDSCDYIRGSGISCRIISPFYSPSLNHKQSQVPHWPPGWSSCLINRTVKRFTRIIPVHGAGWLGKA